MNTRLQVEHGVTELVTGLDLVHLQLRVASGESLGVRQDDLRPRGNAIECRIYAEDAAAGFLPSTGTLSAFAPPLGAGIRNDVGVQAGDAVTSFYDPLLAKLLCVGVSRDDALERMADALRRYIVGGVTTNIPLLRATVTHPEFRASNTSTSFLEDHVLPALATTAAPVEALIAAAVAVAEREGSDPWRSGWRHTGARRTLHLSAGERYAVTIERTTARRWTVTAGTRRFDAEALPDAVLIRQGNVMARYPTEQQEGSINVTVDGAIVLVAVEPPPDASTSGQGAASAAGARAITAPLTGTVVKVAVREGEAVCARQPLVVLEARKMEHTLAAPADATVTRLLVAPGDLVQAGTVLVELS